jgi:hypothetical protein
MTSVREENIILQERDYEILLGIFESCVMTLKQITDLYFSGRGEAAKKRVQKLKRAEYIEERQRQNGARSIMQIGKRALKAMHDRGMLNQFPCPLMAKSKKRTPVSNIMLNHELDVIDARVAMTSAVRAQSNYSLVEFRTWPALCQFVVQRDELSPGTIERIVKPDGYFRIKAKSPEKTIEHLFFLEVDRGTEALDVIARKATRYLHYYQSGGMATRFGACRSRFKDFPFRVLMLFRTEERRNNAGLRLLRNNPPIRTLVWLSTLTEFVANACGAIWVRPKDYLGFFEESIVSRNPTGKPRRRSLFGG